MRYVSFIQLLRSASLQLGEQNGRKGESFGAFSTTFLHVGQTILMAAKLVPLNAARNRAGAKDLDPGTQTRPRNPTPETEPEPRPHYRPPTSRRVTPNANNAAATTSPNDQRNNEEYPNRSATNPLKAAAAPVEITTMLACTV
jgi:hypothetical protein